MPRGNLFAYRHFAGALRHRARAARMEMATRRGPDRAGHIAPEHHAAAFYGGVRDRHR